MLFLKKHKDNKLHQKKYALRKCVCSLWGFNGFYPHFQQINNSIVTSGFIGEEKPVNI
jgi:hypothetical protein